MSFSVNENLCRHCGLCASGCVCGCITLPADGIPCIDKSRRDSCVHCGHCAAVCPEGAITLDGTPPDGLEAAGAHISEQAAAKLLKTRRAIRNFQSSAVDDALLEKVFALAAYAPTAHNARQVSYIVINGRRKVEKVLAATVRLMEKHGVYAVIPPMFAADAIPCFAEPPASSSSTPLNGFFPRPTAPRQPATWNSLSPPFIWAPAGRECSLKPAPTDFPKALFFRTNINCTRH